jgi:TatD DNase family protein
MLVDTHAHLQWASFDKDREKVISRAQKASVGNIVNIGFDLDGSIKGVELAEQHSGLYATIGIHPHNATRLDQNVLNKLRELSGHPKVVAVGEIGLDYYRNLSPREAQKKAFEAQLFLAGELELPVVIHDREAHSDILEIISRFKGKVRGIMHCFSGDKEMAQQIIELGFLISFAGNVTYPNAHKLRETARWIDLDSILIETDSPWLPPQAMRGKRNEPCFLPFIAKEMAELKGITTDELAEATTMNAKEIYQLP